MIEAEEYGITSKNVDEMLKQREPLDQAHPGRHAGHGQGHWGSTSGGSTPSSSRWGNYGEAFERNLGMGSPLKIDRGLNKLWTEGGILYAPPIR